MSNIKTKLIILFFSIVILSAIFSQLKKGYNSWFWILYNKSEIVNANTFDCKLIHGYRSFWYSCIIEFKYKSEIYHKKISYNSYFYKKGHSIRVLFKKSDPNTIVSLDNLLNEIYTNILLICVSYILFKKFKKFKKNWKE